VIVALSLTIGRAPQGWHFATGPLFAELWPLRAPRIAVAGTAGAMLAAAGVLLQRLTANPLAGPEILGVSAGGGVGLAAALMLVAGPTTAQMAFAVAAGSLVVILAMLALAARPGYGAGRLLLAGVAMGALGMAVISTVLAQGDIRSYALLQWMSGSTNRVGAAEASAGVVACLVLLPPLFLLSRWLEILPLGEGSGRALGLSPRLSQSVLALAAALLSGIASLLVGPLSLIGLIAPHLARMLGFGRAREQLAASIVLGFLVMVAADWLSRTLFFPYQVPVGLFASLIGGPYLIWLLNRGRARLG
jgi:iron complex transport system permease protein